MRVVKERMVSISPRERLGADSQVAVGYERVSSVLFNVVVMSFLFLHSAVGAQETAGDGYEQRD